MKGSMNMSVESILATAPIRVLEWNPEFATHIPEIDRDRQYGYGLINRFHEAMLAGQGKEVLGTFFKELAECVEYHTAIVANSMTSLRYPGTTAHLQMSKYITHRARKLRARFERGETAITIELMVFLLDADKKYLKVADRRLGEYVQSSPGRLLNRDHGRCRLIKGPLYQA
jgi:hemerythrin